MTAGRMNAGSAGSLPAVREMLGLHHPWWEHFNPIFVFNIKFEIVFMSSRWRL